MDLLLTAGEHVVRTRKGRTPNKGRRTEPWAQMFRASRLQVRELRRPRGIECTIGILGYAPIRKVTTKSYCWTGSPVMRSRMSLLAPGLRKSKMFISDPARSSND